MARLGIGCYRFSLAWPRIQPPGSGPGNKAGLDFYDRLTDALLAEGITPMPTLYHWDLPQPLEDAGGWMSRDTAYRFADYAGLAAERLADRIPLWITLNEPFIVTAFGYALGIHAPGKALMLGALATAHHQLLGHGLATAALRAAGAAQVAIANNYSPAWPATDSAADLAAAAAYDTPAQPDVHRPGRARPLSGPVGVRRGRGRPGRAFVTVTSTVIGAPVDALGVNYYNPTRLSALPDAPLPFQLEAIPGYPVTAFGWPVIPAGLTEMLTTLAGRYGDRLPPVYITENGCSVADEPDAAGVDRRPAPDQLPRQPHPGRRRCDHRGRRRPRLPGLVAAGQLRVG